jgi:PAS domain S-box-containing protein
MAEHPPRPALTPFTITAIYAVAGVLWLWLSAELLGAWFKPDVNVHVQFIKAGLFLILTAVFLFLISHHYVTRIVSIGAELQERATHAETYFESAAESIVHVDETGRIILANPRTGELFGHRREELLGQPIEILIPERLRKSYLGNRAGFMKASRSQTSFDLVGRRKDGSELPIEVRLNFVRGDKGDQVIFFITDISERLALEREARRAEALVALGAMAAGVVHELNNPISIISNRIELMLAEAERKPIAPELKADLEMLYRHIGQLKNISQGLLSLTRQRHDARRPVDINAVIEDTLLFVRKQMSKDGVQIETALESDLPLVMADQTALSQVFVNLLMNAREAMPHGGRIKIETARSSARPGHLRVTVADSGPGISPEEAAHLFDLFYTTKPSGTGLGLWVSRRILTEHQGDIEVTSEPGKGATFVIGLPAIEAGGAEKEQPIAGGSTGERIS